jgi:hypothetical protein
MTYLALSLLAALSFAGPDTSDRITIQKVHGPKEVKVNRRKQDLLYQEGSELMVGDTVQTVEKQIIELLAYDGSKWKIAPKSQLVIESRKPDAKNFSFWVFQLSQGSLWGNAVPAEKPDAMRMKIKTKFAAMGVRGTEYYLQANDTESELEVTRGRVMWGKNAEFVEGSYLVVSEGQHSIARANQVDKASASSLKNEALDVKYRLAEPSPFSPLLSSIAPISNMAPGAPKPVMRAQDCREKGKGWKSEDGSGLGACVED